MELVEDIFPQISLHKEDSWCMLLVANHEQSLSWIMLNLWHVSENM